MTESEEQLRKILQEMQNEAQNVRGDEFGLFDYHDLDPEMREQKWHILSYVVDTGRMKPEEVATLFKNNPWFTEWYKRTVLSDIPVQETYH